MNFKVSFLLAVICFTISEAKKEFKHHQQPPLDLKGKREAPIVHYGPPRSTNLVHLQHGGGSFSIGAGYSLGGGGGKYSYSSPPSSHPGFGGPQAIHSNSLEASSIHGPSLFSGHGGYTPSAAPSHRYTAISGTTKNPNSQPQITYGVPTFGTVVSKPHAVYGPPGFSSGFSSQHAPPSLPSYAHGGQGLGAYASSGLFSKPLFVPASSHEGPSSSYGPPSFGGHKSPVFLSSGFGGHGLFGGEYSSSIKSSPHSHGPIGGKYTSISSAYGPPSKKPFKPSVYLGSSIANPSSSYGLPSFSHGSPSSSYGVPSSSYGLPSSSYGPPASSYGPPTSSLLSSPIYLSPKAVSEEPHPFASFADGTHGSPSLSGSYQVPSAGHAAPSFSFSALNGNYEASAPVYETPSFGSNSGGYASALVGQHSGFGDHGISSAYGVPSSSGYESQNYISQAATYEVPSIIVGTNQGLSYEGIGSGKQELPSPRNPKAFLTSEASSLYTIPSGNFESSKETYGSSQDSYSSSKVGSQDSSSDAYGSPSETNYQTQASPTTYDTIKYSKQLPIDDNSNYKN